MKRKVKPPQEAEIRKRVEKKFKARRDWINHLTIYLMVNGLLWLMYILSGEFEFPWPVFMSGFWGIGLVSHYVSFYYQYGRGAEKREEEITRQMRRAEPRGVYEADAYADGDVLDMDGIEARHLRLRDDGELTDGSLIDQADYDEAKRKRGGG